ncbi:MAG: hypothetical protein SFY32_08460 [Bacteroidota bacterium]|nr:hypothetical protein [Bacteroidota bacterium]
MRHYGLLSSTWKRAKLKVLQSALKVQPKAAERSMKWRKCPCCKTGNLITIEILGSRGPPVVYMGDSQTDTSCPVG